ncbi:MAG: glycoside hydrolase family 10 protein [Verrucomicrobiales bacterium]
MPPLKLVCALATILSAYCAILPARATDAIPEPDREFRAAWIATVHNLDWPSKPGLSVAAQQAELRQLLDLASSLNLNAVILQVRPAGDALYASRLEPWSPFLTGKMGVSPGYDPLAFAVAEAHRRGLELHAWFNPFRAQAAKDHPPTGQHLAALHPEWVRNYGGTRWFDPGEPGVRTHALSVVRDVVRRYDIDGVHIDDYFYPYPSGAKEFPDEATHKRYGGGKERNEWRRGNTNAFVSALYQAVKMDKPSVKVGISPFGIWRPGYPAGVKGLDSFEQIAADSRHWLRQGWCDYMTPQLYWRIDSPQQSFASLLRWWQSENVSDRCLWPGMATARIGSREDRKRSAGEIVKQIELSRGGTGGNGHVHWSISSLSKDRGGIVSQLKNGKYARKAVVPATPWLGRHAPLPPTVTRNGAQFQVQPSADSRWLVVQARRAGRWETATVSKANSGPLSMPVGADAVAVRSQSASGVLSPAVVIAGS